MYMPIWWRFLPSGLDPDPKTHNLHGLLHIHFLVVCVGWVRSCCYAICDAQVDIVVSSTSVHNENVDMGMLKMPRGAI